MRQHIKFARQQGIELFLVESLRDTRYVKSEDYSVAQYYFFVDEAVPNGNINKFCLGGCVIEQSVYERTIAPEINAIKTDVFGTTSVILHEYDIRLARIAPYDKMKGKEKRELFWTRMREFWTKSDIIVICASIDCDAYHRLYDTKHRNDEYLVTLHLLLENYTHFLEAHDGQGSVFVESRNAAEDMRLSNLYHTIKANGTLFLDRNVFQNRLGTISFPLKSDNNIGLQIADFIPNPFFRSQAGLEQKKPNIFNEIQSKLYDGGGLGCSDRFGYKKIP